MTTKVLTLPRFLVTLGKVASDNVKIQKQIQKQCRQDEIIKKRTLTALVREVNAIETESKKKTKALTKEARTVIKALLANDKKQVKEENKHALLKRKTEKKEANTQITKINKKMYRQKKTIEQIKTNTNM